MDLAKEYLYAAEMTDLLTNVVERSKWEQVELNHLGSLAKLFAHMCRVRNVYQNSLLTGEMLFPGEKIQRGADLEAELKRSRETLANQLANPAVREVKVGDETLSVHEVFTTAVQHEGLHQGQWYLTLKQLGIDPPEQWKMEWALI